MRPMLRSWIRSGRPWPFVLAALVACNGDPGTAPQVATSIELSAANVTFTQLGATQQLTAVVKDRAGGAIVGAPLTWSSSFPERVTVSETGLVTAQSTGTAVVSARSGDAVGTVPVSVSQIPAMLILSPTRIDLEGAGDTMTVVASVSDAGGHPIASPTVTWSSNDESIVTVDEAGRVSAVSSGSAAITGHISEGALASSVEAVVAGGILTGPSGGQVSAANGKVALQIPAAALAAPVFITAEPAQDLPAGGAPIAGTAFELGPDGLTFGRPVTLSISYDAAAVPPGIPEGELRLHKVVANRYEGIEGSAADPDANFVSGSIVGFSVYAVLRELRIETVSLPDASVGVAYPALALSVSGGAGDPQWSIVSGSLPGGLSLSETGALSGVPTSAGSFAFTVAVESSGQRARRSLTLVVHHPPFAVTDLTILERSATTLKIRFTEVDDGTGMPSDYAIRRAISPIVWESASENEVIVEGTQTGASRQVTIAIPVGAKTAHDVQMVAFRGTRGVDAVVSGLSSVATAPVLAPSGLCSESPSYAVATFADGYIDPIVRGRLRLGPGDPMTCALTPSVTDLYIGDSLNGIGASDLAGMQNLTGLQSLRFVYGRILDLSPLASLKNLTTLSTYRTSIGQADPTPLAGLVSLRSIFFHDGGISDLGPLAALENLESVHLENAGVAGLGALASLPRLTELRIGNTEIPDITPLGDFAHLKRLTLVGTGRVDDLEPLARLTGLDSLTVTGDPGLTDITPLAQLTGLNFLAVGDGLTDLGPLAQLTNLQGLGLRGNNRLADIGPLLANSGLAHGDHVRLSETSVSCADIAALEAKGPTVEHRCLRITTTSLPDGDVAVPYTASLTSNSFLPVWSLAAGSAPLPPGLRLTAGLISGTPTQAGSWTFTVEVRPNPAYGDYVASAQQTLSITIRQPPLNLTITEVHLNQGNQSLGGRVGGVADRPGLLRVVVQADRSNAPSAPVRVRLFRDGAFLREAIVQPPIPFAQQDFNLDVLGQTLNLQLSASEVVPGLSVDARVDPFDSVPETNESDNSFPPGGGTLSFDVESIPPLRVVFIPIQSTLHGSIGNVNTGNADDLLAATEKWQPVSELQVGIHAPLATSHDLRTAAGWNWLLSDVQALRTLEGASDQYYHGIIGQISGSQYGGLGYVPGVPASAARSALSLGGLSTSASIVAHELGHNLGRPHAPCGAPPDPDLMYPHANGVIGWAGYDIVQGDLRPSSTTYDYMSYCKPDWTSDYTYAAIRDWRLSDPLAALAAPLMAAARTPVDGVLIWGRIGSDGVSINPAVVSQARPVMPTAPGENTLRGLAANGSELFRFTFDAVPVADSEDPTARHFAFFVPLEPAAIDALVEVTVETPAGSATVSSGSGPAPAGALGPVEPLTLAQVGPDLVEVRWDAARYPLAVIRDRTTGEVLSFARGGTARVRASSPQALLIAVSDGTRTETLN